MTDKAGVNIFYLKMILYANAKLKILLISILYNSQT